MGLSKEGGEPLKPRTRERIERDESFVALKALYPLQACLLLTFFDRADDALEAISARGNVQAAEQAASDMAEIFTWLKNAPAPLIDRELAELFSTLVRAGVPMETINPILQNRVKRGKGAPVTNRLPVLRAVEYQSLHPKTSWMQLAMKFCECGKGEHDDKCRGRIRSQARELDEMLDRLGCR